MPVNAFSKISPHFCVETCMHPVTQHKIGRAKHKVWFCYRYIVCLCWTKEPGIPSAWAEMLFFIVHSFWKTDCFSRLALNAALLIDCQQQISQVMENIELLFTQLPTLDICLLPFYVSTFKIGEWLLTNWVKYPSRVRKIGTEIMKRFNV